MRAIIMAAGVGSRISNNVQKPKSTLAVGSSTIIGHTVELLTKNGVQVAVVVGYQKDYIYSCLKDFDVKYYYNPFYRVTNSMASLWFAKDFIKNGEELILANADVYWEQDIFDEIKEDNHRIMMFGDKKRALCGDYFFKVNKEGKLSKYGKELEPHERTCEYVGIAKLSGGFTEKFTKMLNKCVDDGIYNMWWENVLYENSLENPIHICDVNGKFWGEVDVIEDYERILNYADSRRI